MFVAGDTNGNVYNSADAISWTLAANLAGSAANPGMEGGCYGRGLFAIANDQGQVLLSPDGAHWGSPMQVSKAAGPQGVFFVSGKFVLTLGTFNFITGGSASSGVYVSPDGQSWSGIIPIPTATGGTIWTVASDGNVLLAGTDLGVSKSSDGGATWTTPQVLSTSAGISHVVLALIYAGGLWLASTGDVRAGANTPALLTSADGRKWSAPVTLAGVTSGAVFFNLAYGNGVFVAPVTSLFGGGTGAGHIFWSADGTTWTDAGDVTGAGQPITAVAFDGTTFAAADANGTAYRSIDGKSWTAHVVSAGADIVGLIGASPASLAAPVPHDESGYRSIADTSGREDARAARLRRNRRQIGIRRR